MHMLHTILTSLDAKYTPELKLKAAELARILIDTYVEKLHTLVDDADPKDELVKAANLDILDAYKKVKEGYTVYDPYDQQHDRTVICQKQFTNEEINTQATIVVYHLDKK